MVYDYTNIRIYQFDATPTKNGSMEIRNLHQKKENEKQNNRFGCFINKMELDKHSRTN